MDPFHRDTLDPSGIYDAMETDDMGKVLEAAIKAVTRKKTVSSAISYSNHDIRIKGIKSKERSQEYRSQGNEFYKAGLMKQAVCYYNIALALAPKSSKEMILAYSNRSSVFFYKRFIRQCLKDINTCLNIGCSGPVYEKIIKRREDANRIYIKEVTLNSNEFTKSFFRLPDYNREVTCARADISFETDGVKKVTASAEIKVGSVVAIEKPFVVCHDGLASVCYYCNKPEFSLDPCDDCTALFCSEECKSRCLKEYHYVECKIVGDLAGLSQNLKLAIRAVIKMSLMMRWDEFVAASRDVGSSKMRTATVKEAYNSADPLSVISYIDNEPIMEGKVYNASVLSAVTVLHLLKYTSNYFPREKRKRELAALALGRVMLQLMVNFTNYIDIEYTVFNVDSKMWETNGKQTGVGFFSMTSKLKHSCEPNLHALVRNNEDLTLIALKTIKQGEELTISYGGLFYNYGPNDGTNFGTTDRMHKLFLLTRKICENCRVCIQNWNSTSAVTVSMTNKQAKLFKIFTKLPEKVDIHEYNVICNVLDSFPLNSTQHLTAFRDFKTILTIMQYQLAIYF